MPALVEDEAAEQSRRSVFARRFVHRQRVATASADQGLHRFGATEKWCASFECLCDFPL